MANTTRRAAITPTNKPPANSALLAFWPFTNGESASDATIESAINIAEAIAFLAGVAVIVGVGAEYALPELGLVPIASWPALCVAVGVAFEVLVGFRATRLQGVLTNRSNDRLADAERRAVEAAEDASGAFALAALAQGQAASASRDAEEAHAAAEEATNNLAAAMGMASQALDRVATAELRAAELEKEAGEARERAAKLEKLAAGRRLDIDQAKGLAEVLGEATPASVVFCFATGDHEANTFAGDLAAAFRHRGWEVHFQPSIYLDEVVYGVRIPLSPIAAQAGIARTIHAAFDKAKISWRGTGAPTPNSHWGPGTTVREPSAEVYIGPRWPPDFAE